MSTKRINVTTILPLSALFIGYVAENGVTNVEFDVSAWVTMYGSGTATLIMKRWGDANPYPIALEVDNEGLATWTISATDTAKTGFAYGQLRYEAGTKVKKSPIYTLKIGESLGSPAEAPDQYEDWIDALTHLAAQAMAEALDIDGIVTDKTLTIDGGIADAKATGDALSALEDQFTEEADKLKADLDNLPTYKELYLAPRIKYALKNVLKNSMFFNQYGGEYLEMLELSLNMSNPTQVNYFTTFSAAYESVYLNTNGTKAWNSGNKDAWRSVPITLGNAKYLEYDGVPSYWRGTSVYVIPAIVFTDDNRNVLQVIEGRDGEFATRYQNKNNPSAAHHDMNTSGFVKIPFGATKAYVSVEHISSGDYVGTVYLYY